MPKGRRSDNTGLKPVRILMGVQARESINKLIAVAPVRSWTSRIGLAVRLPCVKSQISTTSGNNATMCTIIRNMVIW